jgi:hypothetical protein
MRRERRQPTRREWARITSARRDPGKFHCAGCGWPSRRSQSPPVTKTWGTAHRGGGRAVADA